jgi:hypothetical protein
MRQNELLYANIDVTICDPYEDHMPGIPGKAAPSPRGRGPMLRSVEGSDAAVRYVGQEECFR